MAGDSSFSSSDILEVVPEQVEKSGQTNVKNNDPGSLKNIQSTEYPSYGEIAETIK
jgi:hypothetical protein